MLAVSDLFLTQSVATELLLIGEYDPALVALSLIIAVLTSYLALTLSAAARRTPTPGMQRLHLITGAGALGVGVWSMHFIGMLAFDLCTPVDYRADITLLSMLPAIFAAWVTLTMLSGKDVTWHRLLAGGVVVGLGIGSMHYVGMAAMVLGPSLRYDPAYFALSIVVAAALATMSLWVSFGLRGRRAMSGNTRRLIAGSIMGLAIAGMHYTAMEAARFVGFADPNYQPGSQQHYLLSFAIAAATILLGIFIGALNALVRYRALLQHSNESSSELQAMFDTAVDAIVKISASGEILSVNRSVERMLGYSQQELLGRNVSMLMPAPHRELHDHYLANYLATGEARIIGQGREVMALHKDGHEIPVRLAIGEFKRGGTPRFVGFLSDITERYVMEHDLRSAKEQAEEAAQAKSAFLANMSHEIRTPMNAILGFTELLMDSPLNEHQQQNLGIVRNSAQSLLALLNDILDTAKFDSGRAQFEQRNFSLLALCQHIVATQSLNAARKGLQLTLDYSPQTDEFFCGDPLRIQQIVLNLLSNAVKFTQHGSVTLKVSPLTTEPGVTIDVEDSGIGIPQDRLESIFAPFSQADSSMTRRFGGTGLGTTIARQLTELMGGQISVVSTVGSGTTFSVRLPLPIGEPVEDDISELPEYPLPPLRILAADDVPQNLQLLEAILSQRGHQLISVSNGRDALTLFRSGLFDLVLMDVQMPEMDGHETSKAIRQWENQHQRQETPIIALTASVLEQDRVSASDSGMNGFASKPLNVAQLTQEIARALGLQASQQTHRSQSRPQLSIDWQQGNSLWGTKEKLTAAIRHFINDAQNQPQQLKDWIKTDADEALKHLHRLKGVSANLCLTSLAAVYQQLESELTQGEVNDRNLNTVFNAFHAVRLEMQSTEHASESADTQQDEVDALFIQALSEKLMAGEFPDSMISKAIRMLPSRLREQAREAEMEFDAERLSALLQAFIQQTEKGE